MVLDVQVHGSKQAVLSEPQIVLLTLYLKENLVTHQSQSDRVLSIIDTFLLTAQEQHLLQEYCVLRAEVLR